MRGSYLAKIVEAEIKREERLRKKYSKTHEFIEKTCSKCKNNNTTLCHITKDIEGNIKCVNYKVEQNT